MSNYDQIQYQGASEPRRRRMARYDSEESPAENSSAPVAPVAPAAPAAPTAQAVPSAPTQAVPPAGDTTRVPRVYDSYRETEAAAQAASKNNTDALLQQRSRAFEKQAQHTGVYTRMTQTGYHQTIRQPQRATYGAADQAGAYADRNGAYEEYQAPQNAAPRRESYERPAGRTNQRPAQPQEPVEPRHRSPDDLPPEEDDGERFPVFARIILIVVLVLILLVAGLYFLLPEGNSGIIGSLNNVKSGIEGTVTRLTGLIRPTEEPATVKSLTCASPTGAVGDKCLFNVTTSQNVTGVALCDMDGSRIVSSLTKALTEGDSLRIWELSVIFEKPYTGDIFASIQQGDNVWITTDKYVNVSYTNPQPTPAPTVIVQTLDIGDDPTPPPETVDTPAPEVTAAPFVIPTAYVVSTPEADVFLYGIMKCRQRRPFPPRRRCRRPRPLRPRRPSPRRPRCRS